VRESSNRHWFKIIIIKFLWQIEDISKLFSFLQISSIEILLADFLEAWNKPEVLYFASLFRLNDEFAVFPFWVFAVLIAIGDEDSLAIFSRNDLKQSFFFWHDKGPLSQFRADLLALQEQ